MDLEQMATQPRVRSAWEGIDLGFVMARRWFVALWLGWWTTAVPAATIAVAIFPTRPWAAFLLLWWFKPALEAPLLIWLSRRLFGDSPDTLTVYRAIPAAGLRDLAALLTYRRFAAARSFSMPVSMLEGLRGAPRGARLQVLELGRFWPGWLTIICLHFETIIYLSVVGFAASLLPFESGWIDFQALVFEPSALLEWGSAAVSVLAMSVIAPFFVAAGFALYLTRRSELEAWDVEIRLRQIVAGTSPRGTARAPTAAVALVALALCAAPALMPLAAAAPASPAEASAAIERILAADDFGEPEVRHQWAYTGGSTEPDPATEDGWLARLGQLVADFGPVLAEIARVVLWLAAAVVVLYLLSRLVDNRDWLRFLRRPARQPRTVRPPLFLGAAAEDATLPADVVGAARALLTAGEAREAVRLLFRATLTRLSAAQLEIPPSSTELECARLVAQRRPEAEARFFADLVGAWQLIAYAHRSPGPDRLMSLVERWREHYEPARPRPRSGG